MNWFNYYGLAIIAIIMLPNFVIAIKRKEEFANVYKNNAAQIAEMIGRCACIVLMIFNIPHTYIGFYFNFAKIVYIAINAVLVASYCVAIIILRNKSGIIKAVILSVIPSAIFVFSGIMIASYLLIVFAVILR